MKFVSLLSSGIDSPVATYLLSKKTNETIIVHGDIKPFTDNREMNNFNRLCNHLKKIINHEIKVYVIPHGNSLSVFKQKCNNRYICILCKRMLLRYAEKIAMNEHADAIIMGDSLGQVASQTLQNIGVIDQAIKLPILRPLIGLDKNEIVDIAREIGTFQHSILPSVNCTAVPKKPRTRSVLEKVLEEENKIDVEKILDQAVNSSELLFI